MKIPFIQRKKDRYKATIYIISVIIILLLLLAGVFYGSWHYNNQDSIAELVPADSPIYLHLDYNNYKLNNDKTEKFFNLFFKQIDDYFLPNSQLKFSQSLKNYLDREIALVLDKDNNWFLISRIKNSANLTEIISNKQNFSLLKGKYLIITKNPSSLKLIKKVKAKPSLSFNNLPWQKNYDKNIIKLFFRPKIISENLNNNLARAFWNDYISKKQISYFYFSANDNFNFILSSDGIFDDAQELIKQQLPINTVLAIAEKNLLSSSQEINKQLKQLDPVSYWQLVNTWQDYEENYHFNFQEIEPLLNHPVQIIVTQEANEPKKFTLIINQLEETNTKALEKIIKNITARHFPKKTKKELPDGTKVTELISDPENLYFEEIKIQDKKIKLIKNDQPLWELAYIFTDDELLISNSLSDLKALIREKNALDLGQECQIISNIDIFVRPFKLLPTDKTKPYQSFLNSIIFDINKEDIKGCLFYSS